MTRPRGVSHVKLRGPRGLAIAVLAKAVQQATTDPATGRTRLIRDEMQREQDDAKRWLQGRGNARIPAQMAADAAGYDLHYVQQRMGLSS